MVQGHQSLSARRAWIEIIRRVCLECGRSLSARRAWIEIGMTAPTAWSWTVALRKESVDRNFHCKENLGGLRRVALRKESVDRNSVSNGVAVSRFSVALRKESVDRNYNAKAVEVSTPTSLSARRAWIEILQPAWRSPPPAGRSPQGERG